MRHRHALKTAAWAALGLAAVLLLARGLRSPGGGGPALGEAAPGFSLPDVSGRRRDLASYKGKVVLLDFWATWCPTCVEELPDLKTLHARLDGRGAALLSISLDEDPSAAAEFASAEGIPYPVLLADESVARDYRIFGLPAKFLLDGEGRVRRAYLGESDLREVEKDAMDLLEGRL